MSGRGKPAPVKYYIDADLLGLARIVEQARGDVTYPGDPGGSVKGGRVRPPCPITRADTPDAEWIPQTAKHGWLIITRDRRIQHHTAERFAVRDSGARMVAINSEDARDRWRQLETLLCQWRAIEKMLDEDGPFIYSLTRTSVRKVAL